MRLGQRLMTIIILVFIGFCLVFLSVNMYRFWSNAFSEFKQRAGYLADLAANSNASNVWNFNESGIAEFARNLSAEETLTSVVFEIQASRVKEAPLRFIGYQRGRGEINQLGWAVAEVAPPPASYSLYVSRPILDKDASLGIAHLYFSDTLIVREAARRADIFILTLLGFVVVYSITIYTVIDRLLLRSFNNLQNLALDVTRNVSRFNKDFAQYHASNAGVVFATNMRIKKTHLLDLNRNDEIGDFSRAFMLLVDSFAMLVEKVTEYSGQLANLNDALEERIDARTAELAATNRKLQQSLGSLQQTQSQLIQQEKLASIGQLAAGVAHEINNPMGFVTSNLNRMGEYVADLLSLLDAYEAEMPLCGEEATLAQARLVAFKQRIDFAYVRTDLLEVLADCKEGSRRVREIVQSLKEFSRVDDDMKWVDFNINETINSTLKVVWNELKYHCDVRTDLQAQQSVKGNVGQLNQVIANLLVNAAHAIKDTGKQGELSIRTYDAPQAVVIEIADSGLGIPASIQSRVFDPFFTTKPIGQGTGLGLNICYDIIINKHKGRISFTTEEGQGTCFTITLNS